MTRICFTDTETTSLRHDRRAWEIAVIVRDPGKPDAEHAWLIDAADLDLGNADPASLRIGRFHERHPAGTGPARRTYPERTALAEVEALTRGAHLVGAVPSFDAEVLGARMRAIGICPSFHYHLIDVETLAAGYLAGSPAFGAGSGSRQRETRALIAPPWKSGDLAAALGLPPVSEDVRHTALGDARFARDIYDAVTGGVR